MGLPMRTMRMGSMLLCMVLMPMPAMVLMSMRMVRMAVRMALMVMVM